MPAQEEEGFKKRDTQTKYAMFIAYCLAISVMIDIVWRGVAMIWPALHKLW